MQYGRHLMVEINLLKPPGLHLTTDDEFDTSASEALLIDKLASGNGGVRRIQNGGKSARVGLRRAFWFAIIIGVAAVGWSTLPRADKNRLTRQMQSYFKSATDVIPEHAQETPTEAPKSTTATVFRNAMDFVPAGAIVDYMEAGTGVFLYRIWGTGIRQQLQYLNSQVEGYQFADLIGPEGEVGTGYWIGAVVYSGNEYDRPSIPTPLDYNAFFTRVDHDVKSSGGVLVEMTSGMMEAGEYVIRGNWGDIRSHMDQVLNAYTSAYFERISLVRRTGDVEEMYLVRVVFNLMGGYTASQQPSSPGVTGG